MATTLTVRDSLTVETQFEKVPIAVAKAVARQEQELKRNGLSKPKRKAKIKAEKRFAGGGK
jgi:hypothetical protein